MDAHAIQPTPGRAYLQAVGGMGWPMGRAHGLHERGDSAFDATLWLAALTEIGGGYALLSGRRLYLSVGRCSGEPLTAIMQQIVGRPDRQEAIKQAIESRQNGSVAA